jgi:hypothetical protein
MIRDVQLGSRIRILIFYPSRIPDPGVKKAPDPGSVFATLALTLIRHVMMLPNISLGITYRVCFLEKLGIS